MKAFVTGGTGGIGRELVNQLQQKGWQVVTTGRNERALEVLDALEKVQAFACDFADPAAVSGLCAKLPRLGPFDMVVNNAGIMMDERFDDAASTPEIIEQEITVNLIAPLIVTRAILPALAPGAKLVNIGSVLGIYPRNGSAVYSASKAGLAMFGQALAVQGDGQYTIHCVYPPQVVTGLSKRSGDADMSASDAAAAILKSLEAGAKDIWIGKSRIARVLGGVAPWAMRRIMAGH